MSAPDEAGAAPDEGARRNGVKGRSLRGRTPRSPRALLAGAGERSVGRSRLTSGARRVRIAAVCWWVRRKARELFEVVEDRTQHGLGARRRGDEEPVRPELVVDREGVSFVCEVDPGLGHAIAKEVAESRTAKPKDVSAHLVPIGAKSQLAKVSGAVVHRRVQQSDHGATLAAMDPVAPAGGEAAGRAPRERLAARVPHVDRGCRRPRALLGTRAGRGRRGRCPLARVEPCPDEDDWTRAAWASSGNNGCHSARPGAPRRGSLRAQGVLRPSASG